MEPLALYIHVPFCVRKCDYCDFASYAGCESQFDAYFEALHGEMESWRTKLAASRISSVFFGGGTPSYPPAEKICGVLEQLKQLARLDENAEITIEANPGTLTPEKLRAYRNAGINRLSIGVQSFDAELLRSLGRIHTPAQAAEAVYMAKDAGFDNISVDLMYALPDQSMRQWLDTLNAAVSLPVSHISAYSLIVEENTPMYRRVEAGRAAIPDDGLVNEMQRTATRILAENGFARYEISNYAREGCQSRHNITYWLGGDYLGLGSAAHSLVDDHRFANPPGMDEYISGKRMLGRVRRSEEDRREEMLMLATRMVRGLELEVWARNFGERLELVRAEQIQKLQDHGLVEITDGFLRLTEKGLELQDAVVIELM